MEHERYVNFVTLSSMNSPKPLIHESFRQARVVAFQLLRKRCSGTTTLFDAASLSSSPGVSYSSVSLGHDCSDNTTTAAINDGNDSSGGSIHVDDETARLRLFLHTPSVAEPQRYSHQGLLNEVDSLQLKHLSEYEFLIPAVSAALNSTIAAHEVWRKHEEGISQQLCGTGDELPSVTVSTPRSIASTAVESDDSRSNGKDLHGVFAVFETTGLPSISLREYVSRMAKETYVSPSILLIACLYIDRLLTRHKSLLISQQNIFKLLATAVRIANKLMDTKTLNNMGFARVSCLGNADLNFLEVRFMQALALDLFVGNELFYKYAEDLIAPTIFIHSGCYDFGSASALRLPSAYSNPATPQRRLLASLHPTGCSDGRPRQPKLPQTSRLTVDDRSDISALDNQSSDPSRGGAKNTGDPGRVTPGCYPRRGTSSSRYPPKLCSIVVCPPSGGPMKSTSNLCYRNDGTLARGCERVPREQIKKRFTSQCT